MQPPFRILCQLCLALSQRAPKDKELELSAPLLHWDPQWLKCTGLLEWSLSAQSRISPTSPPPVPTISESLSGGFLCQESPAGSCSQGKVLTFPLAMGT